MKYLVISQYFWPENFKINEVVKELSKKNEVHVLTSVPNYPNREKFKKFFSKPSRYKNFHGVKIYRVKQLSRKNGNKISILFNYISFLLFAFLKSPNFFFKNYQKIFVFAPSPLLIGFLGLFISKFNKAKTYIWVLDLWPFILRELKIVNSPIFLSFLDALLSEMYQRFDKILVQSKSFKKIIQSKIKKKRKVVYLPSWADDIKFKKNSIKKKKNFLILFTGNLGYAQNLEITLKVTKRLINQNNNSFLWLFVGDGRYKKEFIEEIKKKGVLKYYKFYPRKNSKDLKKYFRIADASFISLKKGKYLNSTIPAKLQTYMSIGIPIIGSISGEANKIIKNSKCGLVSEADDEKNLAKNITKFIKIDKKKLKKMSMNGKIYSENNFNKKAILKDLINIFHE